MKKIIILMLLLMGSLLAEENEKRFMKAEAMLNDGITYVKFLLKSPMLTPEEAEKKELEPKFISHIVAKTGKKIVYEASINPHLCKISIFKFKIEHMKTGDIIKFIATDNKNGKQTKEIKITR